MSADHSAAVQALSHAGDQFAEAIRAARKSGLHINNLFRDPAGNIVVAYSTDAPNYSSNALRFGS